MEDRLLYRFRPMKRAKEIYEGYIYFASPKQLEGVDSTEMDIEYYSPPDEILSKYLIRVAKDDEWFKSFVFTFGPETLSPISPESKFLDTFGSIGVDITPNQIAKRMKSLHGMAERIQELFEDAKEDIKSNSGIVCFRRSKPHLTLAMEYESQDGFLVVYDRAAIKNELGDSCHLLPVEYTRGPLKVLDVTDYFFTKDVVDPNEHIEKFIYAQKHAVYRWEDEVRLVFHKREKWERERPLKRAIRYVVPLFDVERMSGDDRQEAEEALSKIKKSGIPIMDKAVYLATCN